MASSNTTAWFRPTSVISGNTWTNASNAIDSDTGSSATSSSTIGTSTPKSGYFGDFQNAISLPANALIVGGELSITGRVSGTATTKELVGYLSFLPYGSTFRCPTGAILTRTSTTTGTTSHSSVQELAFPFFATDLDRLAVFAVAGVGGSSGQTGSMFLDDIQVRLTYLLPDTGKAFAQTEWKAASSYTSTSGGGSGTIAWGNPGNAAVEDSAYATREVGKDLTHVLLGANWAFGIPDAATPIGIVFDLVVGPSEGVNMSAYDWAFRQTSGGSLQGSGDSVAPTGWLGGRGLLDNTVTPATLNASWFAFGPFFGGNTSPTESQIDLFRARVIYEENRGGGGILLAAL